MPTKTLVVLALLGALAPLGSASARDRTYDFGQVWGEAVQEHGYNDAVRAPTRDIMRQRPRHVFEYTPGAHDPSGNIILEGAK
jgi:hypothetical protein